QSDQHDGVGRRARHAHQDRLPHLQHEPHQRALRQPGDVPAPERHGATFFRREMSDRRPLAAALIWTAGLLAGSCGQPAVQSDAEHHDISLPIDIQSIDAKVPPNATFEVLFKSHNFTAETNGALLKAVSDVFNPRQLRANQSYRITRTIDGIFREFRYQIDEDRLLRVFAAPASAPGSGSSAAFAAEVITMPKAYQVEALVVD